MPDDAMNRDLPSPPNRVTEFIFSMAQPHMPPPGVIERLAKLAGLPPNVVARRLSLLIAFVWHDHPENWPQQAHAELSRARDLVWELNTVLLRLSEDTVRWFEMGSYRPLHQSTTKGGVRIHSYGEIVARLELSLIEAASRLAPPMRGQGKRKTYRDVDGPFEERVVAWVCGIFVGGKDPTTNKNIEGEGRLPAFLNEISPYLPDPLALKIERLLNKPGALVRIRKQAGPKEKKSRRTGPKKGKRGRFPVADND